MRGYGGGIHHFFLGGGCRPHPVWLYLNVVEAASSSCLVWLAIDGTGRTICEKQRLLLLCTLTASHIRVIIAIAAVSMESKFVLCSFMQMVRDRMPGFDWDVAYAMRDGALGIGRPAFKVWTNLKSWL